MTMVTVPVNSLGAVEVVTGPQAVNLTIYQGDDFYLNLTVKDANNNPINMTGWTVAAQVRAAPGSAVVATFTAAIDATVTNQVDLHLPHLQAMKLPRKAQWDCQVTDLNGVVTTLAAGKVTVTPEITAT
jgi:hypothetical protein